LNQKIKTIFKKNISKNLGLINLFGKSFGRVLYLILIAYFLKKLSIKDFAEFAIIWSSLRMFTFYTTNNLYIIYFNKVRDFITLKQQWPTVVSSNIIITAVFFCFIISIVSFFIFDDIFISISLIACLICFIIIRNICEFSKADHNLFLSIFVDDFLFYVLFFLFSILSLEISNSILSVMNALFFSSFLTALTAIILFKRKFNLKISSYKIYIKDFSFVDFKVGINYTFLRGNEVLSNFAVRYLGQIYFGDIFVAYAHIMYQFYNIYSLLTMSVISGFQSKITIRDNTKFDKQFFNSSYKKIIKTLLPFVAVLLIVIVLFNKEILFLLFPKFVNYTNLLLKVQLAGLIFVIIQPIVFILIYNNKFINILRLNYIQYFAMFLLFVMPGLIPKFGEEYWLLSVMTGLVLIQGFFAGVNYNKVK